MTVLVGDSHVYEVSVINCVLVEFVVGLKVRSPFFYVGTTAGLEAV